MMERIIRLGFLLFLSLLSLQAAGQYPATGNKQRLGYQTTGDGLVFRGSGAPAYTPTGLNNAWMFLDTTANDLYAYISGSWQLIGGGGGSAFDGYVDSLVFNTTVSVVDSTGKMYYDAANETISVGIDGGVVYQMGQELFYPLVINKSGAAILNGQLVMVDTLTLVTGDHVRVIPARNGANYPSSYIMGVATADIPNDSLGLVTFFGYVREVKHADIAETGRTLDAGDILYPSAVNPGKYTDVAPATPAHKSTIALVVRKPSDNNMTLLVRPWLAPKLANLSDVNTSSVGGLSVLRYNSTTGVWDASATAGIVAADTAAMLNAYVRGLGTANQVAYWNGTRSLAGNANFTSTFNATRGILAVRYPDTSIINVIPATWSSNDIATVNIGEFSLNHQYGYQPYMQNLYGFTMNLGNSGSTDFFRIYNNTTGINRLNFNIDNTRFVLNSNVYEVTPSYTLDIYATDGIRIPLGTDAQRPTGAAGVMRYNSTNTNLEFHDGTSWRYPLQAASATGRETAGRVFYSDANGRATGTASLTWSEANKTLGVNTSTTSGASIIVKNTQEPSRNTSWLPQQTFGADTVNWTKGTGWTFNGTAAVATAATGALTYTTLPDTIVSGRAYEVTYTLSGYSAGTVTVAVGNSSTAMPSQDGTNVLVLFPTSASGGFRFTTSTFTGNLDNVSVVEVGNQAPIVLAIQDDNTTTLYPGFSFPNLGTIAIGGGGRYTTGGTNNFFGASAGGSNTTGSGNNFFGSSAGGSNTTGTNNNFFGTLAGGSNTIGTSNNFFGEFAGRFNTSGVNNNFFGFWAGQRTTTGSSNNFFGSGSGITNTTGSDNNFFGSSAGYSNTTGTNNNFFGAGAGGSNTIGSRNIFIGNSSGFGNTTAVENIYIGLSAGISGTTGGTNIAIGTRANASNTVGTNNTVMGYQAGSGNRRGSFNVFLGRDAGSNGTTADTLTGDYNISIGTYSAVNIRAGAAGNLILGNSVNLPTAAGSNQVVIKNVIFATGASGTGTNIASGALVGINTNAPAYKLDVFGTDGIRIPSGTDAQRPTGAAGVVRYSSTSGALEYHTGTKWDTVATRSNLVSSEVHYIPLTAYSIGDTVANGSSKAFFLVPAGMNGWCIDSYTVRAISGSGSATVQILDSGTGSFAQAISGTTIYTKDSNVPLTTGDYIQLDVSSVSGTLLGLSSTLEIKKTCN